jgi:RNA polymerase sigma-B factor
VTLSATLSRTAPASRTAPSRLNGYEHLAPLFADRDRLPADDPRRAALRAELIAGYRPVAQHIARKYAHRGENVDDLEQVAAIGLILAVDRFDPERGFDFLSFAVPTITGEVLRYFRDRAMAVRVPRRLRELQTSIYETAEDLGQRLARAPRPSEIAAALGVDVEVVLEGLAAQGAAHCSSLDEQAWSDDGSGDQGRFVTMLARPEPQFDLIEDRETLGPLLAALPARERDILVMRFFEGMTQTEIAKRVGISQMHVSRVLSRTLATLRTTIVVD